jgi:hypothetical protein
MICVLDILGSSRLWEFKEFFLLGESDSGQVDLQASLTIFSATDVAIPRYYYLHFQWFPKAPAQKMT